MVLGSFALIRKVKQRIKEVAEEEYTKNKEYGSHHSTLLDVDNDHPHDSTNRKWCKMIKFYLYSSDDSIEFSHKIEQFQNNPKISIVDIQYQVDKEIYTTKNRFSDTAYNHEDITYFAFITYKEL